MIHLNRKIRETEGISPILVKVLEIINPEMYAVTTIDDFLRNKSQIQPTKKIFPPARRFNGEAVIILPSSVIYTERFPSVSRASARGDISDLNSSVQVCHSRHMPLKKSQYLFCESQARMESGNGIKLYDVKLLYNPEMDTASLFDFETEGPPSYERKSKRLPLIEKWANLTPT